MRVVFVSRKILGPNPGAESAARTWLEILWGYNNENLQVIAYNVDQRGPSCMNRLIRGTPADRLIWCSSSSTSIRRLLDEQCIDVLHIHSYDGYVTMPPKSIPTLVTFHDEPIIGSIAYSSMGVAGAIPKMTAKFGNFLKSIVFERNIWVQALSTTIKTQLVNQGFPENRIRVIPNGFESSCSCIPVLDKAELIELLGLPKDAEIALTVGSVEFRKGLHRLLYTAEILKSEEPRLHIGQSGRLGTSLRGHMPPD